MRCISSRIFMVFGRRRFFNHFAHIHSLSAHGIIQFSPIKYNSVRRDTKTAINILVHAGEKKKIPGHKRNQISWRAMNLRTKQSKRWKPEATTTDSVERNTSLKSILTVSMKRLCAILVHLVRAKSATSWKSPDLCVAKGSNERLCHIFFSSLISRNNEAAWRQLCTARNWLC